MASNINQHKRLAMGEHVTGMKKGGPVKGSKARAKAPKVVVIAAPPSMPPGGADLAGAAGGGMPMPGMKKGGRAKRC
jgi:hypothetical protein